MTIALRWGLPIRPLVLQWATPAGAMIPPPTERDLPALAVVSGPPGSAGPQGPVGPQGPEFNLDPAVIDCGTFN